MPPHSKYDLFISHASEDKISFVRPLAHKLASWGVGVWYDEFSLKVGDSLSRSIDRGLLKSRFGAVVLSPAFIKKPWPEYELRGLISKQVIKKHVILPIWRGLTRNAVLKFSPPLADTFAIVADHVSLEEVARKMVEAVRPDIANALLRIEAREKLRQKRKSKTIPLKSIVVPSTIRHPILPRQLIVRIQLIHEIFSHTLPTSLDETIRDFQLDLDPWNEIVIWEAIATAFLRLAGPKLRPVEKRRELLGILLSASMGMTSREISKRDKRMPESDIDRITQTLHKVVDLIVPLHDATLPT